MRVLHKAMMPKVIKVYLKKEKEGDIGTNSITQEKKPCYSIQMQDVKPAITKGKQGLRGKRKM